MASALRAAALGMCLLAALVPSPSHGHGAVTHPPPRNNIDSDTPPWSKGVPTPVPFEPWCPFGQSKGKLSGTNGQACFWFSNGCAIGCETCDGNTRGPIPNQPAFRKKMDVCGAGFNATVCDPKLRTVNTAAECGAADDWYFYSPWRAPGSAGVFDACGVAGGRSQPGGYGAVYTATPHAKQGDFGSHTLPPNPTGTVWEIGSVVEVAWALQANHGGGYQYRLCPADQPLTEKCFSSLPLPFVGQSALRWDGVNGTRFSFNATYVTEGTFPAGSAWAKNPIPRNDTRQTGASYPPVCDEIPDCGSTKMNSKCRCSGMWGPYNLEIVDQVQIPDNLPEGAYVLGWRWDCEESNQIWSSCSDITLVKKQ